MEREQALKLVRELLTTMVEKDSSDLFITAGFPPAIKLEGKVTPVSKQALTAEQAQVMVRSLMNDKQAKEFDASHECQFAIAPQGIGRFRVSALVQQGCAAAVLRKIETEVPNFEKMGLPDILKDVVMTKRGLVLLIGGTGTGKSTTMAAMIDYRNRNTHGHIITIEDPVEYVHPHKNCVITQREVGVDTESWEAALKNTLRQAPDVILVGEIRDAETMEYALNFAETGHLAMGTIHANNSNQALDRIINFFPEEKKDQLLMDLSFNIRAFISQRLLKKDNKPGRAAAIEIMLGTPLVQDMIFKGKIGELREVMKKSREQGMCTFDQALYELYEAHEISYEEALRYAESANELRLMIKLQGERSPDRGDGDTGLELQKDDNEQKLN